MIDDGVGVAAHDQARIFEPFIQADEGGPRAQEGSGLGLPISREFVRLLGGAARLHSVLGQGSEFSFAIPVQAAGQAPLSAAVAPGDLAGQALQAACAAFDGAAPTAGHTTDMNRAASPARTAAPALPHGGARL